MTKPFVSVVIPVYNQFGLLLKCVDMLRNQPRLGEVVIIDDAQWLDTPTVEALGFIARRIEAEPIIVLIGVRAGHQPTALRASTSPTFAALHGSQRVRRLSGWCGTAGCR